MVFFQKHFRTILTLSAISIVILLVGSVMWFYTPATFTKIHITQDPRGTNPLVAEVTFTTSRPGGIRVTIHGRTPQSEDLSYNIHKYTRSHTVPIAGLYEAYENKVTFDLLGPFGIERGSIQVIIPTEFTSEESQAEVIEPYIKDGEKPFFMLERVIVDTEGYRRWAITDKRARRAYPLSGGIFALVAGDTQNKIILTNIFGKDLGMYTVENGIHHEITEKTPGGNLLAATHHSPGKQSQDAIVELDRKTGEIVRFWDMRDYFDENRPTFAQQDPENWFHLNAVEYDPNDDSLLISSRVHNLVAKIGYSDNKVRWILGNHQYWAPRFKDVLLTPTNFDTSKHADQDWTYLQHTPNVTPNGNILVFDNGQGRPGFNNEGNVTGKAEGGYVRIVEYQVNEKEMAVEKVFEYSDYPDRQSHVVGSVYPFNDALFIGYGQFRTLIGIDKISKEKFFEMEFTPTALHNGKIIGYYRAWPLRQNIFEQSVTAQ